MKRLTVRGVENYRELLNGPTPQEMWEELQKYENMVEDKEIPSKKKCDHHYKVVESKIERGKFYVEVLYKRKCTKCGHMYWS